MFTRHLFILAAMVIATTSYSFAKGPVIVRDTMPDHYKVESPVKETSAQRTVAGEKPVKEVRDPAAVSPVEESTESEVQYWKYSEEESH